MTKTPNTPSVIALTADSDPSSAASISVPTSAATGTYIGMMYQPLLPIKIAVSARTPYNGLVLPAMALLGTLTRDDETTFEGALERTLDPALGYHYGAVIGSVESGDGLTLSVGTPPQVARHKGYETAFLDMPDAELTL